MLKTSDCFNVNLKMKTDLLIEQRHKYVQKMRQKGSVKSYQYDYKVKGLYSHMSPNNNLMGFNYHKRNTFGEYFMN